MSDGERLYAAALALVGTPFRAGGAHRATGVDCVGMVALALRAVGRETGPLPLYRLRQTSLDSFAPVLARVGLREECKPIEPGDILALGPAAWQLHLAIAGDDDSIVHAHGGLLKVVHGPCPEDWVLHRIWRLTPSGD